MPLGTVLVSGVLRGGWAEVGSDTVHWPTGFSLNLTIAVLWDAQPSGTGRPQQEQSCTEVDVRLVSLLFAGLVGLRDEQ